MTSTFSLEVISSHDVDEGKDSKMTRTMGLGGAIAGDGSSSREAFLGLLGGMVFGMVSPMVGHPLDTVKTKMQAEPAYKTLGLWQSMKRIYRIDGIHGFYRGFLPPVMGSIAYRGILFSAYSGTYAACADYPLMNQEIPFTFGLQPRVLLGAVAAAFARATIESPLDFIKVRNQIGKKSWEDVSSKGATSQSRFAMTNHGEIVSLSTSLRNFSLSPVTHIAHLYSGYFPTLLRTMGLLGSFFVMVDYSVRFIPDVINAPLVGPFFKGGVCATMAWTFAFPFETTKSVIQGDTTGKYKNVRGATFQVMGNIYQTKGIRGLYRGFGPGAGRAFTANGVSMFVYTWFQDSIRAQ